MRTEVVDPSLKYAMMSELNDSLNGLAQIKKGHVRVIDPVGVRGFLTDRLVYNAVFHEDPLIRSTSRWMLKEIAQSLYIFPCSTQGIYETFSKKQKPGFVMPAIRIPGLAFDSACAVFRAAKSLRSGAFIFEILMSESKVTCQTPAEYSAVIMAAGIREEYQGPVFLQTGHFQTDGNANPHDPEYEIEKLKMPVKEALKLGYFNLRVAGWEKHQNIAQSYTESAQNRIDRILAQSALIRDLQPEGTTASIEGDFGTLPERTPAETLRGFLERYRAKLEKIDHPINGLSKITVPLRGKEKTEPLKSSLPWEKTVQEIHQATGIVRDHFRLACSADVGDMFFGEEALNLVLRLGAEEIQFSTPFPEAYFSHAEIPPEFREQILTSTISLGGDPSEPTVREGTLPFIAPKSFGLFKEKFWGLPVSVRNRIGFEMEKIYAALFEKFNISNTYDWVRKVTPEHRIPFSLSEELETAKAEWKAVL